MGLGKTIVKDHTYNIVEYLQSYYGKTRDYNGLYRCVYGIMNIVTKVGSYDSIGEFIGMHNDKYHGVYKNGKYRNKWWGNMVYLLGKSDNVIEYSDDLDEEFMYELIGIIDYVIDNEYED